MSGVGLGLGPVPRGLVKFSEATQVGVAYTLHYQSWSWNIHASRPLLTDVQNRTKEPSINVNR